MADVSIPLKQCSRKDNCINPLGSLLPATTDYFAFRKDRGKLTARCRCCQKAIHGPRRRKFYAENAERMRAESKKRRESRREENRLYAQQYRRDNPDRIKESKRRYLEAHKEERREYFREWIKTHPESARIGKLRRRAREREAVGEHTPEDLRDLLRVSVGLCWWCGKPIDPKNFHVDHRIPLSRGGSNAPENLCISCPECNLSKNNKLPQEWNGRLL